MFFETNWTRTEHEPDGIMVMTESRKTTPTRLCRINATMTLTGDIKEMYGDDANVQTIHWDKFVRRINIDGHDCQPLRAVFSRT